ncbi:MAG: peptidoglycan DD-metalloendopeptidase family protein, partial [Porticoccaceae bacterium]
MTPPPVPVVEREQPPSTRIVHHVVSRGDTLHTIAWRYEIDHQQLAALNGLQPPYRLQPGQRLLLGDAPVHTTSGGPTSSAVTTAAISSEPISVEAIEIEPAPSAASAQPPGAPGQEERDGDQVAVLTPPPTPPAASAPPSAPAQDLPPAPAPVTTPSGKWQWPVTGNVSREYDASKVFKGINIHSSAGTDVKAAGAGTVVYAGSGLRGYGQLIILKHDDTYLSAYAHNKKILVSENDDVSQGQVIAEVGGDPADPGRLYFEIREHGKPVDPERLLPAR